MVVLAGHSGTASRWAPQPPRGGACLREHGLPEQRKGAKRADGLQAVVDRIAEMAPADRALAERVHSGG